MKKIQLYLSVLFFVLIAFTSNAQDKKYEIPSGQINYEMNMAGLLVNNTLYFKDYGKSECNEATVEVNGQKGHLRNFVAGGYSYSLDMIKKSYTKVPFDNTNVSYSSTSFVKIAKENKDVKVEGEETILGKKCTVYSLKNEIIDAKYWVWKNMILKMTASAQGNKVEMTATQLIETSSQKGGDDVFSIPSDFVENKLN